MSSDPTKWVQEHGTIMYRFAITRCSDAAVAENLVQETFLAALKSLASFSGRSSERTWLLGILKHKLMDHYRKQVRERAVGDLEELPDDGTQMFDDSGKWTRRPSDWGNSPESALESRDFRDILSECLAALPPKQASVFRLREMDDLDTDEICKELALSETNLWVLMHRARARLRQCLEKKWFADHREG